jgi:hypothetical protein
MDDELLEMSKHASGHDQFTSFCYVLMGITGNCLSPRPLEY